MADFQRRLSVNVGAASLLALPLKLLILAHEIRRFTGG
jgi:hypothetical protein